MKRLLNYILAIFTFASMAVVLVGCGKKVPLTEDQWRSATTQRDFVNSSFTLNSDCYELEDRTKKVFSLDLDVKLNEKNISVDKKTTYASSNPSIDGLVEEYTVYYTLEYGTWVHGAVYYKDGEPDSYNKGIVKAEDVKPLNIIELIFGKAPDECISVKFNEIEIDGSKYIYRDDQKELVFTFEDQGRGYWYRVDTVDFKWVRAPGDTEYYEEGHIKFYDYKNTTVTVPNEINMRLFCQDYVATTKIVELYDTHNLKDRLGHYMIDDKYSIVSVRQPKLNGSGEAMIYFGGQMSTDILALPYTVRKEIEIKKSGDQENVFYLDVESDIISDIKCYGWEDHALFPDAFGGYGTTGEYGYHTWPISFYTGKGLQSYGYISYKVNGVEYVASSTNEVSYIVDAEHGSENGKPICMFYTYDYYDLMESDDLHHAIANTYNTILRTDKQIFAFDYDYFYRVDPVVQRYFFTYELNDELREEERSRYGKIFFATKIYILDITNYEKDSRGYMKLDEEGTNLAANITLYVKDGQFSVKEYGEGESTIGEHSVNLECERTEGIVNYYVFSNND